MKQRIERLKAIGDELFKLANSFSGNATGTAAGRLHVSCNHLWDAVRMLEHGITPQDEKNLMGDWLMNNPGLLRLMCKED